MAKDTASDRLQQVAGHLKPTSPSRPLGARFRPKLPPGLPPSVTPLNPIAFLLKAATIRADHVALTHPEKKLSWTFSEWATRVSHLAYALKARGVKPGDRVMVCGPNVPMVADCLQAIPAICAVIVAINIRQTPEEVEYLLENSGARFVLVDAQFANLIPPGRVETIVCDDDGESTCQYEQFLEEGAAYDRQNGNLGWEGHEFQRDENATFAISYTSGTTSRPKGVETTYRGTYLAAVANASESGLSQSSKYLWILPQFHCLGWCFPYASTLAMCTQEFLRSVGTYSEIWEGLLKRGVTHYCGAPTVQLSIVSHPSARKLGRTVFTCVAGAAPTTPLIKSLEAININVCHVYGLTETYGPSTRSYFSDEHHPQYFEMKTRQGHSFLTADEIRVVKLIPEGEELKVKEGELQETAFDGEEIGEIVMRGNIVMKGYYNDAKATAKAMAGGWFHTGDLAVRYPDGHFDIRDRSKDLIISGGENISSLACEGVLSGHPDVHEVAVVARPHEKWGERPHAFVVLKDKTKWADRLRDFETSLKGFAKNKMPPFAIPEWIEVVTELEKTSTGKVTKKTLRDRVRALPKGE